MGELFASGPSLSRTDLLLPSARPRLPREAHPDRGRGQDRDLEGVPISGRLETRRGPHLRHQTLQGNSQLFTLLTLTYHFIWNTPV